MQTAYAKTDMEQLRAGVRKVFANKPPAKTVDKPAPR